MNRFCWSLVAGRCSFFCILMKSLGFKVDYFCLGCTLLAYKIRELYAVGTQYCGANLITKLDGEMFSNIGLKKFFSLDVFALFNVLN